MTPDEQARAMLAAEYPDAEGTIRVFERDEPGQMVDARRALRALTKALSREERVRGEERERCAGIAENIAPHFRNPMGDAIAAAIRSAPSSQRGGD